MLVKSFSSVSRMFPSARKYVWQGLYQGLALLNRNREWTFMNYGYAPLDPGDPVPRLSRDDEPNQFFIQLYGNVLRGVSVKDRDVVEVGCGRGGGCSYIASYLQPRSMWGVDLSRSGVHYCRVRHKVSNLRFKVGDAEQLPFEDARFDAVLSVESSHCYPHFDRFLAEVKRILRPGGSFHITDLRDADLIDSFHESLRNSGMRIEAGGDITRNVIAAVEADSGRRMAHFRKTVVGPLVKYFQEFAGNEESVIYHKFLDGRTAYFSYLLRAP